MSTSTSTPPAADSLTPAGRGRPKSPPAYGHEPRLHRWTYERFVNLWELGILGKKRVELIDGRIYRTAPQNDPHAVGCLLVQQALTRIFGDGFCVRCGLPMQFGLTSGPEPDVAVVAGSPRDSLGRGHPRNALLVVEVSESSLRYDRGLKAHLYAEAGIADYWIVDVVNHVIRVHRQPLADAAARLGHRYSEVTVYQPADSITPLAAPAGSIAVADLLP